MCQSLGLPKAKARCASLERHRQFGHRGYIPVEDQAAIRISAEPRCNGSLIRHAVYLLYIEP